MTTESITKPVAAPRAEVAVIGQAGPSARAGALRPAHGLRARFRGVGEREGRGYGVWLFVGLVFGFLRAGQGSRTRRGRRCQTRSATLRRSGTPSQS
jgi:hypothetical protein